MSDNPYEKVKAGRLTFKGGVLASRSKTIDKKTKKKKKKNTEKSGEVEQVDVLDEQATAATSSVGEVIYTIDAAKKMKYEDLFPVETKKFGYDPKVKSKSIEEALDGRVKKKADRYCK